MAHFFKSLQKQKQTSFFNETSFRVEVYRFLIGHRQEVYHLELDLRSPLRTRKIPTVGLCEKVDEFFLCDNIYFSFDLSKQFNSSTILMAHKLFEKLEFYSAHLGVELRHLQECEIYSGEESSDIFVRIVAHKYRNWHNSGFNFTDQQLVRS